MKICLINPPSKNNLYNQTIQHIGLGYIASFLIKHGHAVDIVECPGQNKTIADVINQVKESQYDMIGLSVYYYNKITSLKIVKLIRKYTSCFLFLGGYYPTLYSDDTLSMFTEVDCIVIGEGEVTTLEIVEKLSQNIDWRNTPGIAYHNGEKVMRTNKRDLINNLDLLPFPIRPEINNMELLPMLSSRGCYGRCTFCGVKEFYSCNIGKKKRFRSVNNFIEEIEHLIKEYDVKCVIINDETFFDNTNNRQQWLEQFIDILEERNIEINFQCQARANDVVFNIKYIDKMVMKGMTRLFIGLESFVQRQLDLYKKDLSVNTNIEAVKLVSNYDISLFLGLIIIEPFVTLNEILENIDIISHLNICEIASPEEQLPFSKSILEVIDGTEIQKTVKDAGLLRNDGIGYSFKNEETEKFFSVLQRWYPHLDKIVSNMYLIFFIRRINYDVYRILKKIKSEILQLDITVMKLICNKIKEGCSNDEIIDNLGYCIQTLNRLSDDFEEKAKSVSITT